MGCERSLEGVGPVGVNIRLVVHTAWDELVQLGKVLFRSS